MKYKYKVGDRVKIIGNHCSNGSEAHGQPFLGLYGTVERVRKSSGYPYHVKIDGLEHATQRRSLKKT